MRHVPVSFAALLLSFGALALTNACGGDDDPGSSGGTSGSSGGTSGTSGTSGDNGTSGSSGTSGTSGDTGITCGTADAVTKKGFLAGQTLTVGGAARTYNLFVPEGYDGRKTFPLVFVFHGDGGTGSGIRNSFKIEATAAGGAIFVYPDGAGKTWVIDNAAGIQKDIDFVDAIAASLKTSHCVDTKKVFATGFSKGAYFTNMLGCLSKMGLRGVIGHAGGGPFGLDGSGTKFDNGGQLVCPQPSVAALQVQGETDGNVPLSEGTKARDHWRRVNGCATTSKPFDPSPCIAYDGCQAGKPEIWCQIPGLGHQIWTNGAKVTWDFIQAN
ncbi:MAG: hypothetical protein JST00_03425 [Deltaproteobacteria bacterium]|nr:hypothetical protein [Deltaproteobacteria bacterium]